MDQLIDFDINILPQLQQKFAQAEGEYDSYLEAAFYQTESITTFCEDVSNYIISSKGAGKSALYVAILNRFDLPFDYSSYSVIGINNVFGFNDEILISEVNLDEGASENSFMLFWSFYLALELIKDIENNHKEKDGFDTFKKKLKKYDKIRSKLNWLSISDFFNNSKLGISIKWGKNELGGQLNVDTSKRENPLQLQEIFDTINDFYKLNSIKALLLIDRLDKFVVKQVHSLQKKYVFGIIECIENIRVIYSNIKPVLFLRTDLFYGLDAKIEIDKIQARTVELKWKKYEVLAFIACRLLAVPFIGNNYLSWVLPGRGSHYQVYDRFVKLFFPPMIQNINFADWLIKKFTDANNFVNPRLLMLFFKNVISYQIESLNLLPTDPTSVEAAMEDGYNHYRIFDKKNIIKAYKETQRAELINMHGFISGEELKRLFKAIIDYAVLAKGVITYVELDKIIEEGQFELSRDDKFRFIKYLQIIGYWKIKNNCLHVPTLCLSDLSINGL